MTIADLPAAPGAEAPVLAAALAPESPLDANAHAWRAARIACWLANLEEARGRLPDYDSVVAAAPQVPLSAAMAEALLECDRAAELAYRLARRPWEAAEIAGLPPLRAMRALAQLEAALDAGAHASAATALPAAVTVPVPMALPAPLPRLAGSDAGARLGTELPIAAYVAAMNARDRGG